MTKFPNRLAFLSLLALLAAAPARAEEEGTRLNLTCVLCGLAAAPALYVGQLYLHEFWHATAARAAGADKVKIEVYPFGRVDQGNLEFGWTTAYGMPHTRSSDWWYARLPQVGDLVLFTAIWAVRYFLHPPPCLDGILLAWQVMLATDFIVNSLMVWRPPGSEADAWAGYAGGKKAPYQVGNTLAAVAMAGALAFQFTF